MMETMKEIEIEIELEEPLCGRCEEAAAACGQSLAEWLRAAVAAYLDAESTA